MTTDIIIALASAVSALATLVISCYAVLSHRLAKASNDLAQQLADSQADMDVRHNQTLLHLTAATLATGPFGAGSPEAAQRCYKTHLGTVRAEMAKDSELGKT